MTIIAFPNALSISQLAEECCTTRERVRKQLHAHGVKSCGKRKGYDVYRLRDALQAIFNTDDEGNVDPELMNPFERHAFYKAERQRRELAVDAGELILAAEVETERARVMKILTQGIETLPDVLERDMGLQPAVVAKIEELCDKHREALYAALTANDGDENRPAEGAG